MALLDGNLNHGWYGDDRRLALTISARISDLLVESFPYLARHTVRSALRANVESCVAVFLLWHSRHFESRFFHSQKRGSVGPSWRTRTQASTRESCTTCCSAAKPSTPKPRPKSPPCYSPSAKAYRLLGKKQHQDDTKRIAAENRRLFEPHLAHALYENLKTRIAT